MAFAIIISEKGGAERREVFDKAEINVGRVQGNDLMLPKGNVSKRHAKLSFRDGRFLVADLKSTNGTYVNGRKISQATVVREGDKIYVGDFVLRFEAAPGVVLAADSAPQAAPPHTPPPDAPMPPSSSSPGFAPMNNPAPSAFGGTAPEAEEGSGGMTPVSGRGQQGAPPPLPGLSSLGLAGTQGLGPGLTPALNSPPTPALSPPTAAANARGGGVAARPGGPFRQNARTEVNQAPTAGTPVEGPQPPRSSRRAGLGATIGPLIGPLVDRASSVMQLDALYENDGDPALVQRAERLLREQAASMRAQGEAPEGLDADALVQAALSELFGLGPLGPLLDNDEIFEVQALRPGRLLALRGQRWVTIEPPFSSDNAIYRVLARLCRQAETPLAPGEAVIERYLPQGHALLALMPPLTHGPALVVRRRRRVEATVDELVRGGSLSRTMATFLGHCMAGRANLLVVGPPDAGVSSFVAAVAALASPDERVVCASSPDEPLVGPASALALPLEANGERAELALRSVARLQADRLVAGPLGGRLFATMLDLIGEGVRGVVATVRAPTMRQALGRLVAEVCAAHPGLSAEVVREWVVSSFDLGFELARSRDGRSRVLRVVEFNAGASSIETRDVYAFTAERAGAGGTGDGTFQPSGHVPRVVEDLRARGVTIDASLFNAAFRSSGVAGRQGNSPLTRRLPALSPAVHGRGCARGATLRRSTLRATEAEPGEALGRKEREARRRAHDRRAVNVAAAARNAQGGAVGGGPLGVLRGLGFVAIFEIVEDPFGHVAGHVIEALGRAAAGEATDGGELAVAVALVFAPLQLSLRAAGERAIGGGDEERSVVRAQPVILIAPGKTAPGRAARGALPLGFGGQAAAAPAAVRVGLRPGDERDRVVGPIEALAAVGVRRRHGAGANLDAAAVVGDRYLAAIEPEARQQDRVRRELVLDEPFEGEGGPGSRVEVGGKVALAGAHFAGAEREHVGELGLARAHDETLRREVHPLGAGGAEHQGAAARGRDGAGGGGRGQRRASPRGALGRGGGEGGGERDRYHDDGLPCGQRGGQGCRQGGEPAAHGRHRSAARPGRLQATPRGPGRRAVQPTRICIGCSSRRRSSARKRAPTAPSTTR
ncbi:MAG: FHA domain-containing protein [Polyangiaceae bacterium]|nr:FHA domain-containing protein [Polyangiaceae bacterium]